MMIDWVAFGNIMQGWASVGIPCFCGILIVRACWTLWNGQRTS
jgi:hypothetical protein